MTETQQESTERKSDRLLDIIDAVNVLARVEAVIGFLLANRRKSKKHPNKQRPAGPVELRVPRDYGGTGPDVQAILAKHGVESWGGRVNGKYFIMYIKARQARWGIGILRGKGIDVESSVDAQATTARTTWQDGPQAPLALPLLAKSQKPATKRHSQQAPSAAQRTINQIKRWI